MTAIVAAIISGGLALIGVVLTVSASNQKIQSALEKAQAVTDTKLEELTREVRKHNGFAERMPVVEEQIKVINHRLDKVESSGNDGK
jgi:hypothetical protein